MISFVFLASHRRHAEPDVAGRPGGGHRPDHRRLRGGDREHRPAPGRRPDGRRGHRPGQPRDQRRGDRLDADDDPGLRAAGLRARRDRAVLPVAEPGAVGGPAGVDGRQPDAHAGAGGSVPGPAADARHRPDLRRRWPTATRGCCGSGFGSRGYGPRWPCWRSCPAGGSSTTWRPASCPRWTKGPSSSTT